jgi:hypothetical protein
MRPILFTCSAMPRVCAALARSPTTTPLAFGARSASAAARVGARVQDDLVALLDQRSCRVAAEAIRGTGDEDTAHAGVLSE